MGGVRSRGAVGSTDVLLQASVGATRHCGGLVVGGGSNLEGEGAKIRQFSGKGSIVQRHHPQRCNFPSVLTLRCCCAWLVILLVQHFYMGLKGRMKTAVKEKLHLVGIATQVLHYSILWFFNNIKGYFPNTFYLFKTLYITGVFSLG